MPKALQFTYETKKFHREFKVCRCPKIAAFWGERAIEQWSSEYSAESNHQLMSNQEQLKAAFYSMCQVLLEKASVWKAAIEKFIKNSK